MGANRWRRFADWDNRPLRLDKFAVEDAENGFAAFRSPHDPKPGIAIEGGRVVGARRRRRSRFRHDRHLHRPLPYRSRGRPEAMAMPSSEIARMLVDMNVPRTELTRLAHGMTPAKLAEVVAELNAMEIAFAYSKMRARKTPGNQGHVTNAKDDPAATRRRRGDRRRARLRRDRDHDAGVAKRLVQCRCLLRRRVGRPRGDAVPVRQRGGGGTADRHGGFHLLCRDGVGLRHRARLHGRRRYAVVEGVSRHRLCLARHQDALHLRRRVGAADGLP